MQENAPLLASEEEDWKFDIPFSLLSFSQSCNKSISYSWLEFPVADSPPPSTGFSRLCAMHPLTSAITIIGWQMSWYHFTVFQLNGYVRQQWSKSSNHVYIYCTGSTHWVSWQLVCHFFKLLPQYKLKCYLLWTASRLFWYLAKCQLASYCHERYKIWEGHLSSPFIDVRNHFLLVWTIPQAPVPFFLRSLERQVLK